MVEHAVDELGPIASQLDQTSPRVTFVGLPHAPAEERLHLGRDQRSLMTPVLEQLTVFCHPRQQVASMRTEPGEQRQLL